MEETSNLNIQIPKELHNQLKMRAAQEGKRLRDYCLELLAKGPKYVLLPKTPKGKQS